MKLFFAIAAAVVGTIGFSPYLKEIFTYKTKPHIYTWIIFSITQGTALAGMLHGGAGWATIGYFLGVSECIIIALFSIKYGTKNITFFDTVLFILVLFAIVEWWQFNDPVKSIIMVSFIDAVAYIPSIRKSYYEPHTESIKSWILWIISPVLFILALSKYNVLTAFYSVTTIFCNIFLVLFLIVRKNILKKI